MNTLYPLQWSQIKEAVAGQGLGQAQLFQGSNLSDLVDFLIPVLQLLFCQQPQKAPCLQCADCKRVLRREHPDLTWIAPEKAGSAIKIEAIRSLQETAYITPQRARNKVVVILEADRLNVSASNALLKILEEPPPHLIFILLAQQLSTMLPTVLSRCQLTHFATEAGHFNQLLALAAAYPKDSARFGLVAEAENLLDRLIAFLRGEESVVSLVKEWTSAYALEDLLWFLYLVFAELQLIHAGTQLLESGPAVAELRQLAARLTPFIIFSQLDTIRSALKQLKQQLPLNGALVLESLLLSLV